MLQKAHSPNELFLRTFTNTTCRDSSLLIFVFDSITSGTQGLHGPLFFLFWCTHHQLVGSNFLHPGMVLGNSGWAQNGDWPLRGR